MLSLIITERRQSTKLITEYISSKESFRFKQGTVKSI